MNLQAGTLYIVGTPIGNLEDTSFRAVRILQTVNLIAAEDTRHTAKLLQHFAISTPQVSYYEHNTRSRIPVILDKLGQGQSIALVTDAGVPGISDPGSELVQICVEKEINVVPIPGPSAVVTALSASGLSTERFVFEGFLPTKPQARRARLEALAAEPRTIVLYESPHRLCQTLAALSTSLGDERPLVLARELTKLHESFWRGSLASAIAHYSVHQPQGEFTLVIDGASVSEPILSEAALKAELENLLQQGLSRSQASRQLAQQTALTRRQIYQLALTIGAPSAPSAISPVVEP